MITSSLRFVYLDEAGGQRRPTELVHFSDTRRPRFVSKEKCRTLSVNCLANQQTGRHRLVGRAEVLFLYKIRFQLRRLSARRNLPHRVADVLRRNWWPQRVIPCRRVAKTGRCRRRRRRRRPGTESAAFHHSSRRGARVIDIRVARFSRAGFFFGSAAPPSFSE